MKIKVLDIIGKPIAIATEDGETLFGVIKANLQKGEKVEVSFKGIQMLISHFLNESIGKLYKTFDNWDILDKAVTFVDMEEDDYELLMNKVIPASKNHFKNIERSEKIQSDILNGK